MAGPTDFVADKSQTSVIRGEGSDADFLGSLMHNPGAWLVVAAIGFGLWFSIGTFLSRRVQIKPLIWAALCIAGAIFIPSGS